MSDAAERIPRARGVSDPKLEESPRVVEAGADILRLHTVPATAPAPSGAPDRVTRLVLVNAPPSYESRTAARGRGERILRLPVVGDLVWNRMSDDRIRATMRSAFAPGHDVGDVFVDDLKRTTRAAFTGSSAAIDDYLRRRPLPQRVAALTQQAFVVFGEQDGRVDPASLDGYGPVANATVATIPEAGHTPVWEVPERTAELILTGAGAR